MDPLKRTINGHTITLYSEPRVFSPTVTTWFLIEQVLKSGIHGKSVLDLGCGSAPIAIALAAAGAAQVHATDLMADACELARRNVAANAFQDRITILQGDLFEPVAGMKFDLIVDDVSGVAESVARLSSWFPDGVPLGGFDGTAPTIEMLKHAERHLKPAGELYFPVLSLCAAGKIIDAAEEAFGGRLSLVASKQFPFNQELNEHLATLVELRNRGLIHFEHVRSRMVWKLDIYRAMARG